MEGLGGRLSWISSPRFGQQLLGALFLPKWEPEGECEWIYKLLRKSAKECGKCRSTFWVGRGGMAGADPDWAWASTSGEKNLRKVVFYCRLSDDILSRYWTMENTRIRRWLKLLPGKVCVACLLLLLRHLRDKPLRLRPERRQWTQNYKFKRKVGIRWSATHLLGESGARAGWGWGNLLGKHVM